MDENNAFRPRSFVHFVSIENYVVSDRFLIKSVNVFENESLAGNICKSMRWFRNDIFCRWRFSIFSFSFPIPFSEQPSSWDASDSGLIWRWFCGDSRSQVHAAACILYLHRYKITMIIGGFNGIVKLNRSARVQPTCLSSAIGLLAACDVSGALRKQLNLNLNYPATSQP